MKNSWKLLLLISVTFLLAAGCSSNQQSANQPTAVVVQSTPSPAPTIAPAQKPTLKPKSVPVENPSPSLNQSSAAGSGSGQAPTPTPSATPTTAPVLNYVTYQGQDGKTALELLQAKYKVGIQVYSGIGDFVTSIDGVTPDSKHFWEFFVNGQSSNVGASSYVTKSSDVIEWKLSLIGSGGD